MKKILLLFIALFFLNSFINATNLRGQILRNTQYGAVPLAGVRVDIVIWNGYQWVSSAYAITGNDGFYFFINFSPGIPFYIQVFGVFYPSQPLMILNYAPPYYQDIPVIYS